MVSVRCKMKFLLHGGRSVARRKAFCRERAEWGEWDRGAKLPWPCLPCRPAGQIAILGPFLSLPLAHARTEHGANPKNSANMVAAVRLVLFHGNRHISTSPNSSHLFRFCCSTTHTCKTNDKRKVQYRGSRSSLQNHS